MYPNKFSERASASLCAPYCYRNLKPDPDETGQFLTSVVERHHLGILQEDSGDVYHATNPQKELLHSALPFLSPDPDVLPE